jgi:CheY-like chemotaxis protein
MTRQAILCVDDEAIIVMSIKEELKRHFRERFIYETAYTAAEGIEVIDELAAEGVVIILVISDWLMPGMKGDEFLAEVKRRQPGTKTILVTGQASPEAIERMRSDGLVNSIILKPWRNQELIERIESLLGV